MDGHITKMMDLIPKDGSTFDIQRLFFLLTMDSATHFLFGESVGSMRTSTESSLLEKSTVGNAQGFAEAFNRAQEYLVSRSRAMAFYWLVNPKEFREANQLVHEVVDHYVRLALEAKRHPEKKESGRYIFAEALAEDTDDPRVIRDNMLNILLAGRDTTASLLSSAFFYLARHPNVWTRLRQTIVDEFGDAKHPNGKITHARLKDTPYLRYFLNEGEQYPPPPPHPIISPNKTSPPSPPPCASKLPCRRQRYFLAIGWWARREVPRLRAQGRACVVQRICNAPSHRLIRPGCPCIPTRAMGREQQAGLGIPSIQRRAPDLSWT